MCSCEGCDNLSTQTVEREGTERKETWMGRYSFIMVSSIAIFFSASLTHLSTIGFPWNQRKLSQYRQ